MFEDVLKLCDIFHKAAKSSPEYLRNYMRNRYHIKRQALIDELGGECFGCGAKENLHFDHIDKRKKTMRMSDAHSTADHIVKKEMKNIQLLCSSCHKNKTKDAWDFSTGKPRHGTYWMHRKYGCRCEDCVEAYKESKRKWRKKKHPQGVLGVINVK